MVNRCATLVEGLARRQVKFPQSHDHEEYCVSPVREKKERTNEQPPSIVEEEDEEEEEAEEMLFFGVSQH